MIRLQEIVGLPTLQYHLDNELTLSECVYRYSSDSFVQLFTEARQALRDGKIKLNEQDLDLIETTDIGEYGMYEGQKVPLDLPMEYENYYQPILEDIAIYGSTYEAVNIEDCYSDIQITNDGISTTFSFNDKHGIQRQLKYFKGGSVKLYWVDPKTQKPSIDDIPRKYEDTKVLNTFGKIIIKVILPKYNEFAFHAANTGATIVCTSIAAVSALLCTVNPNLGAHAAKKSSAVGNASAFVASSAMMARVNAILDNCTFGMRLFHG